MYKYTGWNLSASRSKLGEYICPHVVVSYNMVDFQSGKFVFELAYFRNIVIHSFICEVPLLVDLLDDKFGITKHE